MRHPREHELQLEAENWNLKHPVGTAVRVMKDNGSILETVTTSQAYLLSGHTPVVFVNGITGCYLLSRCKPVSEVTA